MVIGFVCFIELLGNTFIGSHDFPKDLSVMALIMKNKFCLSQWNFLLRSSIFLSSVIFEERMTFSSYLVNFLPCPRDSTQEDNRARLALSLSLQQSASGKRICVQKLIGECSGSSTREEWGQKHGAEGGAELPWSWDRGLGGPLTLSSIEARGPGFVSPYPTVILVMRYGWKEM